MTTFISASMLNDHISCSQKVGYRIFGKGEAVTTNYMLIGTIVHNAVEKFWNSKSKATSYAESNWNSSILTNKDRNTIKHCVNMYFDNFSKFMTKEDEVEKNFKIKLYDDVFIVGKIDRISNGIVYDWKTSNTVPTKLSGDVQFIIYNYAYENLYKSKPNAMFLASLSKGNLVPYDHSEFHSKELFEKVIPNLIRTIKNKSFQRDGIFKKGTCHFCSYKDACLGKNNDHELASRNDFAE